MNEREVFLNRSALKHGISPDDIAYCMEYPRDIWLEQDDPTKWLYLGFTRAGAPLEVVTVIQEDGSELIIHAMKQTKKYNPGGGK